MAKISSLGDGGYLSNTDLVPVARSTTQNAYISGCNVVRVLSEGGLAKASTGELKLSLSGVDGQLGFLDSTSLSSVNTKFILETVQCVETDCEKTEITSVTGRVKGWGKVFGEWERISHNSTTLQPANPGELTGWVLGPGNAYIDSTINSSTYIGFVSNTMHDSYKHTVNLKSSDNDNDWVSVILAYAVDPITYRQYTLSLIRSTSGNGSGTQLWRLVYNYGRSDSKVIVNGDGNVTPYPVSTSQERWSYWTGGVNISVIRQGDVFTCSTTDFSTTGGSLPVLNSFTVNLNTDPLLKRFKGKKSYGYGCLSQKGVRFTVIEFKDTSPWYDTRSGEKFVYDFVNDIWTLDITTNLIKDIGVGRFITDRYTEKMFYTQSVDSVARVSEGAVPDEDRGIVKDSCGKLGVKVQLGGGIELNTNGELKLSPPAAASTSVVVRPSDAGATDAWVNRFNVSGELRPCFKTLTQASVWARQNLTGGVTIYVDEDTIEGSDGIPGVNGGNCVGHYHSQAAVDAAFGVGSGLRAGVYVTAPNPAAPITGGVWWAGISSENLSSRTTIIARYLRGGAYTTLRYFNDAPRAINYNVYISNENTLAVGTLGTLPSNWLNQVAWNSASNGMFFVRSMAYIGASKMSLINLNFVSRTNTRDINVVDISGRSDVNLHNVTISMLGTGVYCYNGLRIGDNSSVYVNHERLHSRVTNTQTYPGYGLCFVGNKSTVSRNRDTATKANHLIQLYNKSMIRIVDYNPWKPNNSTLGTAIIVDGDFVLNGSCLFVVEDSTFEHDPTWINSDSIFFDDRFDFSTPTQTLRWPGVNASTYPFWHSKLSVVKLPCWNQLLRRWTIDSSVNNAGATVRTIPMQRNAGNLNVGIGSFTATTFTYNAASPEAIASTTGFYNFNNSTNTGTLNYPDLPYLPVNLLPQFNSFYNIAEGGATYILSHGINIR